MYSLNKRKDDNMKYFIGLLSTKNSKKRMESKSEFLALFKLDYEDEGRIALEHVRKKLPVISPENYSIEKMFDLSDSENFLNCINQYINHTINVKIKKTKLNTYYIDTSVKINVFDLRFHDLPVSFVHVISRPKIIGDPDIKKWLSDVNEEIDDIVCINESNYATLETSMIQRSGEIHEQYWRCLLMKTDVGVIFHDVHLNMIMEIASDLYQLAEQYQRWLYFFFVDNNHQLYKVTVDDKLTVERC